MSETPDIVVDVETTDDRFLDGRLRVRQAVKGARASIDPFFLAAAVPLTQSGHEIPKILEAGTGSGVVGLTLAACNANAQIVGVDIEAMLSALARHNAALNGFQGRFRVIEADVTAPLSRSDELSAMAGSFDHVVANPPFYAQGTGRASPDALKCRAHRAEAGSLDHWIRFLTAMASAHGTLTLIHSPSFLTEILSTLEGRFGDLVLFPLFSRAGQPAKRIIISGIKGSRAPQRLLPGITLHKEDGGFTGEAEAVLREGKALDLRKV